MLLYWKLSNLVLVILSLSLFNVELVQHPGDAILWYQCVLAINTVIVTVHSPVLFGEVISSASAYNSSCVLEAVQVTPLPWPNKFCSQHNSILLSSVWTVSLFSEVISGFSALPRRYLGEITCNIPITIKHTKERYISCYLFVWSHAIVFCDLAM